MEDKKMNKKILTMELLDGIYGVCRLDKNELIPNWAQNGDFFSITRTADELSIVCSEEFIPSDVKCPLVFSLVGILASISTILAQKGITIFAISTYDTDYILVKNKDIDNTVEALVNERYEVIC